MYTNNRISQIYNPSWKAQDKKKMEKIVPRNNQSFTEVFVMEENIKSRRFT